MFASSFAGLASALACDRALICASVSCTCVRQSFFTANCSITTPSPTDRSSPQPATVTLPLRADAFSSRATPGVALSAPTNSNTLSS